MRDCRIVHLTTVHPRSDTRIFYREVQSLAQLEGTELQLIVADGKGTVDHACGSIHVPVCDLGGQAGGRVLRMASGSWKAIRAVRKIQATIVHFHDPELIPAAMVLRLLGHKIVYDVHEDVPRQILSKYWIPRVIRRPMALVIGAVEWVAGRAFDAIVAATPTIADRFPTHKTVVVQNFPVLAELVVPDSERYRDRPNQFVYVGALTAERGVREVIEAVGLLDSSMDVSLGLAGEFRPTSLQQKVCRTPGWERVRYHGWASRAQVAELLGSARAGLVVLHPIDNYLDAYPVKMFEYMAAGLPVIASDFPLWRRIVEGAGCGVLVDPREPEEIAKAMRWIIDHPTEAEQMGRRGGQAVREHYNWDSESMKLVKLYRSLLQA